MNDSLNNSLYDTLNPDLNDNFNAALNLCAQSCDYYTLLGLLDSEKIVEKQFAALNLAEIKSKKDAKKLVSKLVNQDGKVREAVAFKVKELAENSDFTEYFYDESIYDVFLDAIIDINGNVCRKIVDVIVLFRQNKDFCEYFYPKLIKLIENIWENIEKLDLTAKQYVVSKRNFQLYWTLETLYYFNKYYKINELKKIFIDTGNFYDYTIREKIARILVDLNTDDGDLLNLVERLKNDENYYVRRYFKI